MKNIFKHWRQDLPASLVVFLVALPLCLGVGLASTSIEGMDGMPNIFSGLISGIIGGIVVGIISGSRLGVSGPAAGLITIVLSAITTLGSFEAFLTAVVLSGIIQLILGFAKAGILSRYFPSAVIKGMLAAIGLILIYKQIPHAAGYDVDFFGDESFFQRDGHNTFSELIYMLNALHPGAIVISVVSIGILILFERPFMKRIALFKILPGALFVVITGIGMNLLFAQINPEFVIKGNHLVTLPVMSSLGDLTLYLSHPDLSALQNPNVYLFAGMLAVVGSLETLLSVEATDKLDPDKHHTPTNRELKAQGIGNIASGLLGGLPITQVIVRSSANINTGAKSKLSTVVHGVLLFSTVLFIPKILNLIPLASLAGILIMIGYKLAKISLFKAMFKLGVQQWLPFITTIFVVLFTDLLIGIGAGIAVAIFFILRENFQNNYKYEEKTEGDQKELHIRLSEEVTFLNKASILELLTHLDKDEKVIINGSRCKALDHDVLEVLQEFKDYGAPEKNIQLTIIDLPQIR